MGKGNVFCFLFCFALFLKSNHIDLGEEDLKALQAFKNRFHFFLQP